MLNVVQMVHWLTTILIRNQPSILLSCRLFGEFWPTTVPVHLYDRLVIRPIWLYDHPIA